MGVGVRVGSLVEAVGTAAFLNSFFSTVVARLENGERGARFPALATFYGGELPATAAAAALTELRTVREELAAHPPSDVVWDLVEVLLETFGDATGRALPVEIVPF